MRNLMISLCPVLVILFLTSCSSQREILKGSSDHWEAKYEFTINQNTYQDRLNFKYRGTDLKTGEVITYELLENGDKITWGTDMVSKNKETTFSGGENEGNGMPPSLDRTSK